MSLLNVFVSPLREHSHLDWELLSLPHPSAVWLGTYANAVFATQALCGLQAGILSA